MNIFKMREKNITKRAVAFIMAFAMVISIMLPSGAGLSLNAASSNTLLVDITSLVEADVKDVPSQRDSAFGVDITYTIPQSNYGTAYDSSYDEIIWIYDLTTFISSYPELSNIVDKSSGSIVEGNTERGTYTISGNKVYLDVDKDWLESVIHPTAGESSPASISGTFSMDVKLDAKEIGSKDSISFKFPGAQTDTTLQFPNGSNVQTSKNVIGENGGNVSVSANPDGTYNIAYIVTVTPSTYEKDSLHVMDQLNNSSQNYIPGSFMVNVDGQNIDVSSYTTVSGQSADTNLFAAMQDNNVEISAGKSFNLSYTTTIPASELGKDLVNSVYATWGTDKSSSPVSKTVTPKNELNVTKAYSYVDQDAKIFKYTITIGDATTDLSGLNIKDNMKDLQKLVGDITLNGTVINPTNNTFTDTTFADNTAELFNYTTSSSFGTGPITIEYNVQIPDNDEAPNIDGTRTITNAVDVSSDKYSGHDDTAFTNDFQEVGVGKVAKSFVSFDTADNKVNWNISITNDGDNALVDAYVTDTASANVLDNIYDYQPDRVNLDTGNIVVTDGTGAVVPSSSYSVENVPYSDSKKIVFSSIPAHTTYNIAISSSPKNGDLVNGVTYRNKVELYNKNQTKLGEDQADKTFEDTSGSLSINKSYIYNKTDKTFDWYVVINENNTLINPDKPLYFVDELPEGMEYVSGSMNVKVTGTNSKGYSYWANEFPANPTVSGNTIGPVDVSDIMANTWIGQQSDGYVGISGVCTVVTYKTKLTATELDSIKGTYGFHRYSNTFKATDSTGTNVIAQDTDTAVYEYSFLTKTDLSPADLPDNDYIKFNIDVNPDALTLNNGNPLTLKDNLSTSIELMTNNSGEHGFTIKDENGKDLLASGDATLSYNDDNRLITMTIPDSTHVIVGYSTRTRGLGDINVVNSAELIGSSSLDSDSTSENHKVSHHSATIGAGKLCLHKIDENDIFKELSDAKFDVYKLELDSNFNIIGETKVLENVTGASGYYYFDSAEFVEGSVYYWKEVHAPSGYELDSTPHYFNFYKEDSNTALVNNPSYIAADELDSKVTNANGITVAKIPFNYTWTVCNTKSSDVFGSFSVTKALAKADTLENKYFTDTVKAKEFTAVITVEVPDGKTPITGSVSIASGKTADFSLVSGSSRKSSATVSIKDGEVYTINNLPIGTTYTVTEADLNQADTKLGYENGTVTGGTNNDGTGTVENINTVSTVTLNNIYNPKGTINVTKKFVSPQNTSDTFYFALYSVKVPQNETLVTGSVKSVNVTGSVAGTTANVSWDDIPYGTYKVYETDSTGAVITSSPYTVIDNGLSVEVNKASVNAGIITNTESQVVGELSVSKTVSSDLASDKNKEFDFTVTLGDTSITGTYGDMSFTNGVATFSLKDGESKSATGLPQGTAYTVVEAEDNGFTTTKTGDTGTISSTASSTASFTNTRKTGKLTLSKTVASSVASDKTKAFSFTITLTPAVSTDKITGTFGGVAFTNNVGTVSLKDGESASITGLPIGTEYVVTETAVDGFVTTKTGDTGTISTTASTAAFTNTKQVGGLTVTKTVSSPLASDKNKEFSFKVTLGDTSFNGTFGGMTFANGVATFKLKDGETKSATGLPQGTTYTVTETADSDFDTTKTGDTGTISSTATSTAAFTNARKTGELKVSKSVVSNYNSDFNTEFSFQVELNDTSINGTFGDMSFVDGISTFTLKGGESAESSGIPIGVGYTVSEGSTELTTTSINASGTISSRPVEAVFTNTRESGDLEIKKTVVSTDSSDKQKLFGFEISLSDTSLSGTYGNVTFTDGKATIYLRDGESKSATGLPAGIGYSISEMTENGFDVSSTNESGTIKKGKITATFTNTKIGAPLVVKKTVVSGVASDLDKHFNFTVTLNNTSINGTYGDMMFTNGVATFSLKDGELRRAVDLPVGVGYIVTETADSDFDTTKTGDTGTISTTESVANFTNTRVDKYGSFKIKKSVTENGQTAISNDVKPLLAGTYTFTVYTDQACTHTYKNAAGNDLTIDLTIPASCAAVTSSEVTNILEGDYWIKETVPSNSVPVTNPVKITVAEDKTGNNSPVAEFTNNIVTKETSLTASKALSGREFMTGDSWTFAVTATSGTPMPANTSVTINPTSGSSTDIDFGAIKYTTADIGKTYTYTITETGNVDYVTNDSAKTVSVSVASDGNGGLTITKSTDTTPAVFTNVYSDERVIKVSKVDIANGDEVAGATIQILDENGNVVKDSNGNDIEWVSTTTPKEIYGLKVGVLYTLREVVAPDGYTIATDTNFKINYDGSIDNNITNGATVRNDGVVLVEDTKTKVSISKMDVVNDKELPGATIHILDSQGNKVKEWISTSIAHVIEGLKTGETYTLKETVAPNGFQIATETTFTLDEYGNIDSSKTTTTQNSNGVLLVEDWPQGSIVINKEGFINETCGSEPNQTVPLEGVEFTLEKPGDASFTSITKATDENGIATFTNLDAGKYTITETKTIGEYIVDTNTYSAEIDAKGNYSGLKKSNGDAVDGNKLTNDQTRGDIEFVKVNLDDSSETLAGSTYGLYTTKGEIYGRTGKQLSAGESKDDLVEIAEATTDSAGKIKFTGVLSNVEYTVQEKVAPNGFYVSEKPMKLKITKNANGNTQMTLMDDGNGTVKIDAQGNITWLEPEVKVSFLKTDEAGRPLAGAKLKVVDENGKDVISWTSTSAAYDVTGKIISGKSYKLVETEAPSGYEIADPVSFTVSLKAGEKGADVIQVTMKDVKTPTKSENPTTPTTTPGTTPDTSKKDSTGTPDKQTSVTTPSPAAPNKPNTVVDTGDSNPIIPIAIVLLVAVIGIVVVIIFKKKNK